MVNVLFPHAYVTWVLVFLFLILIPSVVFCSEDRLRKDQITAMLVVIVLLVVFVFGPVPHIFPTSVERVPCVRHYVRHTLLDDTVSDDDDDDDTDTEYTVLTDSGA